MVAGHEAPGTGTPRCAGVPAETLGTEVAAFLRTMTALHRRGELPDANDRLKLRCCIALVNADDGLAISTELAVVGEEHALMSSRTCLRRGVLAMGATCLLGFEPVPVRFEVRNHSPVPIKARVDVDDPWVDIAPKRPSP